jgi:hypothetical protein
MGWGWVSDRADGQLGLHSALRRNKYCLARLASGGVWVVASLRCCCLAAAPARAPLSTGAGAVLLVNCCVMGPCGAGRATHSRRVLPFPFAGWAGAAAAGDRSVRGIIYLVPARRSRSQAIARESASGCALASSLRGGAYRRRASKMRSGAALLLLLVAAAALASCHEIGTCSDPLGGQEKCK